ncbi:MAG: pyruvate kinase [Ghiorsea sp.]|nr:pyruvate kinase [Ghiorsea sp.]
MKFESKMKLLKHKRTKIIATIGPACADEDSIRQMIQKGVNVFRLNMSHGKHAEHYASCQMIRNIAVECKKHIAVLVDLCGPKIRTGTFKNNQILLVKGDGVTITMRDVEGEPSLIPSQYKGLAHDVALGQRIFLADGVMELVVEKVEGTEVYCRVLQGGMLGNHKGINLPDSVVSAPSMTEKDYDDAMFAVGLGVDFLALSFVRHVDDIHLLRAWLEQQGSDIRIIAKIERPEALEDACAVIEAADAIMVARGDLGVELPPEQVPISQDMLIKEAKKQCKPVIVATQVLESMIEHARPTRAEATDIFHSVSSSADAIMLSGETAVGKYPVESVAMMARVIINAEAYLWHQGAFCSGTGKTKSHQAALPFGSAVARSTSLLSRDLMVHGIVVLSESGWTTVTVSSERPESPILAVTSSEETCRRMNLIWGVIPVLVGVEDMGNHVALAKRLVQTYNLAKVGDPILLVQGFHRDEASNCPSIMVLKV